MTDKINDLSEYQVVTRNLKEILKSQSITYKELAQSIGLSESGVKKIFGAKDGAFQRLVQICDHLGVSLSEAMEENSSLEVSFTDMQQKTFQENPLLFKVYWMLVYERLKVKDVEEKLKLNADEMFRVLHSLDKAKLLKLLPQNRLKIPTIKPVNWMPKGNFVKGLYKKWSRNLLDSVNEFKDDRNNLFLVRYLPMTAKTYEEFKVALLKVEEDFITRSIRDMKTKSSETHHVRWLTAMDDQSFVTGDK